MLIVYKCTVYPLSWLKTELLISTKKKKKKEHKISTYLEGLKELYGHIKDITETLEIFLFLEKPLSIELQNGVNRNIK